MAQPDEEPAIVAAGALAHVREVQRVLADAGIEADFIKPPEDKGSS